MFALPDKPSTGPMQCNRSTSSCRSARHPCNGWRIACKHSHKSDPRPVGAAAVPCPVQQHPAEAAVSTRRPSERRRRAQALRRRPHPRRPPRQHLHSALTKRRFPSLMSRPFRRFHSSGHPCRRLPSTPRTPQATCRYCTALPGARTGRSSDPGRADTSYLGRTNPRGCWRRRSRPRGRSRLATPPALIPQSKRAESLRRAALLPYSLTA
jgi:hypothetical protein